MAEIMLTNGKLTVVDDEFYPYLNQWNWAFHEGYAYRYTSYVEDGEITRKRIWLHRVILGLYYDNSMVIDHINGDTLCNTRKNLRICTPQENSWNRKGVQNSSSRYKGVTYRSGSYRVRVSVGGKMKHIGTFTDEIASANAYNYYARQEYGDFARLNDVPFMDKEEWLLYKR